MFEYIEAISNSLETTEKAEKVQRLYTYLSENKNGLIPYQKRIERMPELNENLKYGAMGNCEHTVYLTVAKRMKHRSATWSPQGSLYLCKILCLKASHNLTNGIKKLTTIELPEKFREETTANIMSAGRTQKVIGKGYETKNGHLPLFDAAVTEGRKAFKRMLLGV